MAFLMLAVLHRSLLKFQVKALPRRGALQVELLPVLQELQAISERDRRRADFLPEQAKADRHIPFSSKIEPFYHTAVVL